MKAYVIAYEGIYLGGHVVVIAENEAQAMGLVTHDATEIKGARVQGVFDIDRPCVVYNDNGDY